MADAARTDTQLQIRLMASLRGFARDEGGATAIEYAMIAGGIALVIVTAVNTLGETALAAFYNTINAALSG